MSESLNKYKRTLRVFEGIFLIFFSVALVMNMGYAMRGAMAAFLFVFGHGVYLVAGLLIFEGFFLIIRGHLLLPKKWQVVPLIILILGIGTLFSTIELETFGKNSDDVIRNYLSLYNDFPGGFFQKGHLNLFVVPFGGGIFGYLLAVPIAMTGNVVSIIIPSLIILSMLFVMIFPYFRKIHLANKEKQALKEEIEGDTVAPEVVEPKVKKVKEPKVKKIKEPKPPKEKKQRKTKEEKLKEKYRHSFVNETDALAHADEVGEDESRTIVANDEIVPVTFTSIINDEDMDTPIRTIRPSNDTGTLERAQIDLFASEEKKEPVNNPSEDNFDDGLMLEEPEIINEEDIPFEGR